MRKKIYKSAMFKLSFIVDLQNAREIFGLKLEFYRM